MGKKDLSHSFMRKGMHMKKNFCYGRGPCNENSWRLLHPLQGERALISPEHSEMRARKGPSFGKSDREIFFPVHSCILSIFSGVSICLCMYIAHEYGGQL